jgi:FMN phosphatase YigB (HAD superfamily)
MQVTFVEGIPLKGIKAIIFDLDNTLLHFEDYWDMSVKNTFNEFNATRKLNSEDLFSVYQYQDKVYCELFDAGKISLINLRRYVFLKL